MEINFIPIDYDYFDFEGKNYVRVIGRDDKGKRVCVVDEFDSYLWTILEENVKGNELKELIEKIKKIKVGKAGRETCVEGVEVHEKNYLGERVKALKISVTNYKDAHDVADKLDLPGIDKRREYDIPLITKYIKDKKLVPLTWYAIKGSVLGKEDFNSFSESLEVDVCVKLEKLDKIQKEPGFEPRILAYDIESSEFDLGRGEILMISLCGKNFKKVLTWKKCSDKQDFVECFKDEEEMLKKFVEFVKAYSPDLLLGYFSDGFDLPYLKARADINKMKLSLGLDESQPVFSRGRITSGSIAGIVHIDLFRFIETAYSQYMQSETLSLNEVAGELLGEKKHEFDFAKMKKMKDSDWRDFFEYNLQDSCLTLKLGEKIWPDMLEFSRVMQEPLFDVTRDGMSTNVENYIIHNLDRFNEIVEKRPIHEEIGERRSREKYEGAFVFQPTPGLYEDIAIFDFTSMHASIIVSYNLSKATLLEKKEKECYESPELELEGEKKKFYFTKKPGFFPTLLGEIVELRKKYKKELKEKPDPIKKARSNAYKLLANAYYGYMGFFGARYYSIEAAASTLGFVRKFNKWTMDKVNEHGYKVIFGDTDSVGFCLSNKSKNETLKFLEKINEELPGIMELELEDFYKRGIWVTKRTGEFGAKKKYALLSEKEKIKIRGFETVRRDWCTLARVLQSRVLDLVLKEGNEKKALELVKETVKKLKERKIDKKEIMIRTQLKKPISEYLSISPHVVAAQKMQDSGLPVSQGMLVEFFIAETRERKALVRDKVKLPDEKGEYNIEYYLNNQVLPAVENILEVFGVNIKEIIDGSRQKTLF